VSSSDGTDGSFTNFDDDSLIGGELSCLPLVLNQRKRGLNPTGRLWLPTPEADSTQLTKPSLSDANPWSQRLEIFIVADEDGIKSLTDARYNLVGRVLGNRFSQENNLMTRITKYAGYGVRNAIIQEKFD
jgi:hypothetical protein